MDLLRVLQEELCQLLQEEGCCTVSSSIYCTIVWRGTTFASDRLLIFVRPQGIEVEWERAGTPAWQRVPLRWFALEEPWERLFAWVRAWRRGEVT